MLFNKSERKPRVLLVAATTGYQVRAFDDAARALGIELVMATDRCHHLDDPWGDQAVAVRFDEPEKAADALAALQPAPDAVIAVGDRPAYVAAVIAARLGLPGNPPEAVDAAGNKFRAHERFRAAGLNVAEYRLAASADDARDVDYPCVLKPLGLSASRGVIRADTPEEFRAAFERIRTLLDTPELKRSEPRQIQVERFIRGLEYAVEGLLIDGRLKTLAIFDKPDPLDGPYFEETIYVTPSRCSEALQRKLTATAEAGAIALGLTRGPIHAELRTDGERVWILEVAARPIGGLCSRALRFTGGATLEELLLRNALGDDVRHVEREDAASAVMMIPVPKNGVYRGVEGLETARTISGVEDVVITAKEGQRLLKLPEGSSYLGFIFARGTTAAEVELAVRRSHELLRFDIATEVATGKPAW